MATTEPSVGPTLGKRPRDMVQDADAIRALNADMRRDFATMKRDLVDVVSKRMKIDGEEDDRTRRNEDRTAQRDAYEAVRRRIADFEAKWDSIAQMVDEYEANLLALQRSYAACVLEGRQRRVYHGRCIAERMACAGDLDGVRRAYAKCTAERGARDRRPPLPPPSQLPPPAPVESAPATTGSATPPSASTSAPPAATTAAPPSKVPESACSGGSSCATCPMRGKCASGAN